MGSPHSRNVVLTITATLCFLYFYTQPFRNIFSDSAAADFINDGLSQLRGTKFPDFGQYVPLGTLDPHEFPLDDPSRRVIIVGDVHGQFQYLQKLLDKVEYDSSSDVLVHVGDIMSKGSHKGSMSVISFMAKHNVTGVRGNHDQKVVEWRAWLDWIHDLPGGPQFLISAQASWEKAANNGMDLKEWLKRQNRHPARGTHHWWKRVPNGWVLFGDHFSIAYELTDAEWRYLRNLPLRLYIPSAHTFIAHAGILPEDIRYKKTDKRQPLARPPVVVKAQGSHHAVTEAMRQLQETKVLNIRQNKDAYVVLNMRSILKGKITRENDGLPWMNLWNEDMDLCSGYTSSDERARGKNPSSLPCMPSTVVYGHSAARGLDINRWTIGLDTGCVYGRRLTAVVLGRAARGAPKAGADHEAGEVIHDDEDEEDDEAEEGDEEDNEDEDEDELEDRSISIESRRRRKHKHKQRKSRIRYGDRGHGRLYSVKCR